MGVIKVKESFITKMGSKNQFSIVNYTDVSCVHCEQVSKLFEKLSEEIQYKEISFLQIEVIENPIAKREVEAKQMPFLGIFKEGLLLDCASAKTEDGIRRLLSKLKTQARKENLTSEK
jgi:hypothetical protein